MTPGKGMRLLDTFCGAGGAAVGYHRAGFEVVGIDVEPQSHYPFEFHQADALEYKPPRGEQYDVVWHDIWPNICTDNLPEMHKLHRKYGRRCNWQGSWCRAEHEYYRERGY